MAAAQAATSSPLRITGGAALGRFVTASVSSAGVSGSAASGMMSPPLSEDVAASSVGAVAGEGLSEALPEVVGLLGVEGEESVEAVEAVGAVEGVEGVEVVPAPPKVTSVTAHEHHFKTGISASNSLPFELQASIVVPCM